MADSTSVTSHSTPPITVLLADDHATIRQGLRALFDSRPGFIVVQDIADGADAVDEAVRLSPDVVVLDVSMPADGLATIRRLKLLRPDIAVVVWTRHRDGAYAREAVRAGAVGYVLQQSRFDVLAEAVTAATKGHAVIDGGVTYDAPLDAGFPVRLSPRELDVLRRASTGRANKDIAVDLGIAVKTVEIHKSNGMRKMRLKERSDLIRFAVGRGWLTDL